MINYNKLMKKLDDKGITTYVIRQKGLIPQSTLTKLKMCSGDSMEQIEKKLQSIKIVTMERILCVMYQLKTIEDICQLLQCQPQDIIDWEVELNPELSYENRYKNAK